VSDCDNNNESGHVPISERRLDALRPSPENNDLYRPVSPDDPEVRSLAESIRRHGVLEPLAVTLDDYILSGHRRYVAAAMAGLESVPVRVENVRRGEGGAAFLPVLREFNRQRVKSLDEVVREEVVSMDPEESYRLLVEHRQARARVQVQQIVITGEKRRARISKAKQPFLDAIQAILEDLRDYWPLSVRQIHYHLLNDPPLIHASKPTSRYRNAHQCYKSADELLVRARFEGLVPFEAIQDKTRSVVTWDVHRSTATFVRKELDDLFKGYYRDLMQSQPNHVEIIGEKNTVEGVIRPAAMEYCIPYTLGRGYASVPPRKAMAERFVRSGKDKLIILVLSDFDPEGEDIGRSFAQSMRDDLGIKNVVPAKVGLTQDQVGELQLPPQMKVKETSSRAKGFQEKYGDDVYELEAVPPAWMQGELRRVIDTVLDIKAFNQEVDAEKGDASRLAVVREKVRRILLEMRLG
jgi:hypothetical protein